MNTWGQLLSLDCHAGNLNVSSKEAIYSFIKELVPAINMIAYGEPSIEHFAQHDPTKSGYTLVQLIETSSITCHFVDSNGDFYLDVFSCKEVPVDKTIEVVKKYFSPKNIKMYFISRQA